MTAEVLTNLARPVDESYEVSKCAAQALRKDFLIYLDNFLRSSELLMTTLVETRGKSVADEVAVLLLKLKKSKLMIEEEMCKDRSLLSKAFVRKISSLIDGEFANDYLGIKDGSLSVALEYERCRRVFVSFFAAQNELRLSFERLSKAKTALAEVRLAKEQYRSELQSLLFDEKKPALSRPMRIGGLAAGGEALQPQPGGLDGGNIDFDNRSLEDDVSVLRKAVGLLQKSQTSGVEDLSLEDLETLMRAKELVAERVPSRLPNNLVRSGGVPEH
ncbi:hypothetical protein EBR21_08515 [bacterium]|nr:hypothetical protein [bacterium]